MENNSDLNNQAAQYTLCFNTRCPKAENCLRHSMTQYTTAQNIRLSVINPLCYPAAGKECPHFRSNKKIRVAWGFKKLYDDMPERISRAIHLNLEAIPFALLPVSQPEAGAYSEAAGVHPPGMPEAWLERGDTVRPVHRGIRLVSTLSVFHRRVAGIPPQDTSTTGRWYREYQPLVALVPRSGTRRTLVRYFSYQTVVRTVPSAGTKSTKG